MSLMLFSYLFFFNLTIVTEYWRKLSLINKFNAVRNAVLSEFNTN